LLRRVRDVAQVRHDGDITLEIAREALDLVDIDAVGLDRVDRMILEAILTRFSGGPVGLSTLSVAIGEEKHTLEDVYEPFLLQRGFLQRTPRGRIITELGRRHLGAPGCATRDRCRPAVLSILTFQARSAPTACRRVLPAPSDGPGHIGSMSHPDNCPNAVSRSHGEVIEPKRDLQGHSQPEQLFHIQGSNHAANVVFADGDDVETVRHTAPGNAVVPVERHLGADTANR